MTRFIRPYARGPVGRSRVSHRRNRYPSQVARTGRGYEAAYWRGAAQPSIAEIDKPMQKMS
jgi:hypothetical protein